MQCAMVHHEGATRIGASESWRKARHASHGVRVVIGSQMQLRCAAGRYWRVRRRSWLVVIGTTHPAAAAHRTRDQQFPDRRWPPTRRDHLTTVTSESCASVSLAGCTRRRPSRWHRPCWQPEPE
jgi:hypothetical protein